MEHILCAHLAFYCATWMYAVNNLYLHVHTRLVMSMNRKHMHNAQWALVYDSQLKYAIWDVCRPSHSILSVVF